MKASSKSLVLLLGFFMSLPVFAQGGVYKVAKIKGNVQAWSPKAQRWETVRLDDRISDGTLVQFDQRAMIRVQGIEVGGRIPKGFAVRSQNAMVMRLERKSLRRFRLGGYHVPIPPSKKKKIDSKDEPEVDKSSPNVLEAAWTQAISIFDGAEKDPDATEQEIQSIKSSEPTAERSAIDNSEAIAILHPKMGSNLIVGDLPTTVVVIWQDILTSFPEEDRPQYRLSLWRDVEITGAPTAITEDDRIKIEVNAEGRYYLRVQTLDGRFRSPIFSFTITKL